MKKIVKSISATLCLLLCFSGSVACGGTGAIKDEKVLNIQVVRSGFGVDWIYELEKKFEAAYANEGYKVNILEPARDMTGLVALKEMARGNSVTGVDLYIVGSITPDQVGVNGEFGVLCEDLRHEVYEKPAIGYDGKEESLPISDKIENVLAKYTVDSTGTMYGFNWVQSSGGLVVNTKKLARYGLSLPRTTNEMFDCFEKIYLGNNGVANSVESGTFPITYVSGSNGYTTSFLNYMMAQYDFEEFTKFWSMEKIVDGEKVPMLEDGYEVFNSESVLEMLKMAYRAFDQNLAAYGSTTQGLDQAQSKIMRDKEGVDGAVFMFNGDWMLNEVRLNFKNNLEDIDFINYPVISAFGVKKFGAGTDYDLSEAKCDELLSYIVSLVDENKTIEEISAAVQANMGINVTDEDLESVAKVRGMYYSRGVEHIAYVNKDALSKDLAFKFLRMMASNDFAQTFIDYANATTPYSREVTVNSQYAFVKHAAAVTTNRYKNLVKTNPSGLRLQLGFSSSAFITVSHIPALISSMEIDSIYNDDGTKNSNDLSVYERQARKLQAEEYNSAKTQWEKYLSRIGK